MRKVPNLLEHDNVLSIVIEFDTSSVLHPARGSLFGVIAETTPVPQPSGFIAQFPTRFDWIGKPEQTNVRLNNGALKGVDDLRDLWNQQTPFAVAEDVQPLSRKRLIDSLTNWNTRNDREDWTPTEIAANANVFLEDFLLFDVSKPITDASHLEIEKSTVDGLAYTTGGGRTINAIVSISY